MTLINKTVKEWLLVVVLALLWSVLCLSPFMAAAAGETSPQHTDSVADRYYAISVAVAKRSKRCLWMSLMSFGMIAAGCGFAFYTSTTLVDSLDTANSTSLVVKSVDRIKDKFGTLSVASYITSVISPSWPLLLVKRVLNTQTL
eukprot:GHVQ01022348.1.p1 GENE.GHVQ01022348.1~~GHVQ01022348.1.p1  ORF type:complete len:144 (+),score=24.49 GHVQ01022348.1:405-836(+)